MKAKKLIAVIITAFMTFSTCLFTLSPTAAAILSKNGNISLHVTDSETKTPLPGASFRLYFFASAHKNVNGVGYEYISPYEECKIALYDLQDSSLPVHLTYFAQTHSMPYTERITDSDGMILFDDLAPGIYLIIPTNNITNYYMPSPFVINLPQYDKDNQTWLYDIVATPKMRFGIMSENNLPTYISVQKKWDTEGETPESITVVLLRDLQEYDRVQLSDENNWYYRWDDLSSNHIWNVVEVQVPDGYMVKYETSAKTVTIINSDDKKAEETTQPVTQIPESESDTTTPPPPTTNPDNLIQTGQINWPVPVFSITGLLLFSIGWAMLNLGKKQHD